MSNIILKRREDIEVMRRNGVKLALIMRKLLSMIEPGLSTMEIEKRAVELTRKEGVRPSFKGYEGYPFATVICVNEEVVHGMPSNNKQLQEGDVVTIDYGVWADGFHTDMARTVVVGDSSPKIDRFLHAGKAALANAIDAAVVGNRLGDIAHAIQSTVEPKGYSVIRAFVGHGVGRDLHEAPQVYGVGRPGEGIALKEGMVLAIEVMYTMGSYKVKILDDGWTAVTADGSLSAMYENTVAITKQGPNILTPLD